MIKYFCDRCGKEVTWHDLKSRAYRSDVEIIAGKSYCQQCASEMDAKVKVVMGERK